MEVLHSLVCKLERDFSRFKDDVSDRLDRLESRVLSLEKSMGRQEVDTTSAKPLGGAVSSKQQPNNSPSARKSLSSETKPVKTETPVKDIRKALGKVEENYLKPSANNKTDKEIVQKVIVQEILQKYQLKDMQVAIICTGGSYELTGIPGHSDYDIQFCLKMPKPKINGEKKPTCHMESSPYPAWRKIKGEHPELIENGYLSAYKARQFLKRELRKAITQWRSDSQSRSQKPEYDIEMTSATGPALTLSAKKLSTLGDGGDVTVKVDVVITIRHEELLNGEEFDLVAKPFDKSNEVSNQELWRVSYSRKEQILLKTYDSERSPDLRRKLALYRVIKVIRIYNSQMRALPNYFYKNCLFKLTEGEKKDKKHWTQSEYSERFKEFIGVVIDALECHRLPIYHNHSIDLLEQENPSSIESLKNYLKGLQAKSNYIKLFSNLRLN